MLIVYMRKSSNSATAKTAGCSPNTVANNIHVYFPELLSSDSHLGYIITPELKRGHKWFGT